MNDSSFVKVLAESSLKSVPSQFNYATNDSKGSYSDSIPVVDFSLITSPHSHQRSKALQDLAKACEQWGFFVLINHGISETMLKNIMEVSLEFFDLPAEERRQYEPKSVWDPIQSGVSKILTVANQRISLWRDYVKTFVHPEFHCPDKPQNLREILSEYSERSRSVLRSLLEAISENLGLEKGYIHDVLKLDSGFQIYAANYYPPCPEPDQAIGLPPHTDYGLLTFLIHNGVAGLQIQHNGEWFNTNSSPRFVLVFLIIWYEQIFSNGRYKSIKHRAIVNSESTRFSIVLANGPALDVIVSPAEALIERDGHALYGSMKFSDYIEKVQTNRLEGKSSLEYCLNIQDK